MTVFIVIAFIKVPKVQVFSLLAMFGANIVFSLVFKPFLTKSMNKLATFNQIAYFAILLIMMILYLSSDSTSVRAKFYNIGYPIIGIISVTLLTNAIVCLIQAFYVMKLTLSVWGKKTYQSRVSPELDESRLDLAKPPSSQSSKQMMKESSKVSVLS